MHRGGETMTLDQAKQLYIAAGGPKDHTDFDWQEIHKEIEAVVAAKSDRAAGSIIFWWDCWRKGHTATAFARKIREDWKQMNGIADEPKSPPTIIPCLQKQVVMTDALKLIRSYTEEHPMYDDDLSLQMENNDYSGAQECNDSTTVLVSEIAALCRRALK
jgi:hypothetical protein